ncbi:MAG: hypothetical protein N2506_02375, partial [Dehalococcoidales bacterium]|nr:hypothetical protein [Dehalococcoidales bacterium]
LERADVVTGEVIISVVRRVAPVLEGRVKMVEALPSGAAVAGLAGLRLGRGGGDDVLALAPLYLKEATVKAFTRYHPSR